MFDSLFEVILLVLFSAVLVSAVFHKLRLPALVGYIVVGVLVGPHSLGIIENVQDTGTIAKYGIVFMMFTIGLEFSLTQLIHMRRMVFGCGSLQVVLTILCSCGIGVAVGMTLSQSIVLGCVVAMSSTAIVSKQLKDQMELNSDYGSNALAILLFQDLAVIPILILIPSLAITDNTALYTEIGYALANGVVAILLVLIIGRWLLRPIFTYIAETRSYELFTITILLITLGSAWISQQFGLSSILGAFVAGMMLGETEFRHRIETDIRPFRDVLLGLFFISIGTQLNLPLVTLHWQWVALLLMGLIVFKTLGIFALCYLYNRKLVSSMSTALILAQGGEFSFAILAIALSQGLLPDDYGQVTLGAILLTMVIAPFIIRFHRVIIRLLFSKKLNVAQDMFKTQVKQLSSGLEDHVILCGYGRLGQNIARFLDMAKIPYIALELDPSIVNQALLAGENVCYADASHYEILELANLKACKVIVVTFEGTKGVRNVIEQVRHQNKHLPIIARGYHGKEIDMFYESGATEVISETLESSMVFASHILLFMGVGGNKVNQWIEESRQNRYDLLRMVFPNQDIMQMDPASNLQHGLHVLTLDKNAFALKRTIESLRLPPSIRITAIRRSGERIVDPSSNTLLQRGDIIVLFGNHTDLERAETIMLDGKI